MNFCIYDFVKRMISDQIRLAIRDGEPMQFSESEPKIVEPIGAK